MWVLDYRDDALFAYDLAGGALLAEYALHDDNDEPHGIWSDGVSVWVSNHDPKRLFAYRLPMLDGEAGEQPSEHATGDLERVRDEEFDKLSRAGNNSPRGIWSDGDVMYVADANDGKVYSYNMPDAIDARLASLTLSGVDIGEFSGSQTEYEGTPDESATQTTVMAAAMQQGADVAIDPTDADEEADGHQVALADLGEITVTVTSADGSREKVYRVSFPEVAWDPARDPWPHCLRGDIAVGFSLVVYEGGSVEDLDACARSRNVTALYTLDGGEWVSYILGVPEFANDRFSELYAGGVLALTPLIVKSEGPETAAPIAAGTTGPWAACLQGEIVEGFNLVLYEGGSVEDLAACAEGVGLAALYVLNDGVWISYIVGAPEFLDQAFRELFPDGLAPATPLLAKSDGPSS